MDQHISSITLGMIDPLDTLTGFFQIMLKHTYTLTDTEIHEFALRMDVSVKNIIIMMENYSYWSLLQKNEIEFIPEIININGIISTNINYFESIALQKNISIISKFNQDYFVLVDRNMMNFVFKNLISNAVKFNLKGRVVSITVKTLKNNFIQIEVADNGIGIEQDKINLFKKNISFTSKGTAYEQGNGLGLLTCKAFIKKHAGKLSIESKLNHGTSVIFTLPYIKSIDY